MSWPGQSAEHDADHSEADEGRNGSRMALEVACQSTVSADPGQGAFDDPALGKNDEAVRVVALDDLQLPGAGLGNGGAGLGSLITGVGENAFEEREQAACAPIQDQFGAIAILNIGRMDGDIQEEAERVDEDMPLAARDFLAGVEALRVERRAPF